MSLSVSPRTVGNLSVEPLVGEVKHQPLAKHSEFPQPVWALEDVREAVRRDRLAAEFHGEAAGGERGLDLRGEGLKNRAQHRITSNNQYASFVTKKTGIWGNFWSLDMRGRYICLVIVPVKECGCSSQKSSPSPEYGGEPAAHAELKRDLVVEAVTSLGGDAGLSGLVLAFRDAGQPDHAGLEHRRGDLPDRLVVAAVVRARGLA